MPFLGLFPTDQENKYRRQVHGLAKGKTSSQAVNGIMADAETGRKAAFAEAYSSRGNQALARRQAQNANTEITTRATQAGAVQREQDQKNYQAEDNRLEAQRLAGIHNAIGMGAQAAGMVFGGPMGGAAANGAAQAVLPGGQPPAATQAPGQAPTPPQTQGGFGSMISGLAQGQMGGPSGSMGGPQAMSLLGGQAQPAPAAGPAGMPDFMSLVTGGNAPRPTAPSAQGQQNVNWATQPMTEEERRRMGMLSDERMKEAARNGNPDARRFLDELTTAMQGLRSTLPAELQASADKAIAMNQPQGFTGESIPANESKDWARPGTVFDNVEPKSFNYSAEGQRAGGAPGQQLGVMAQDVERFAPQMVNEDPMGNKRIDVNQGLSAVMAAQADLNQRIRRIEGDPLAEIDSETADPLDNLRDTEQPTRPDLYNRPGNQRDVSADRPVRSRRNFAEGVRARVRPQAEPTDSPLAPGEQPGRAEDERYAENSDFLRAFREFHGRPGRGEQTAEPVKGQLHGGNAIYPIGEDYADEGGRGNESNARIRERADTLTAARRSGRALPQAFPGTDYDLLNRLVGGSKLGRRR